MMQEMDLFGTDRVTVLKVPEPVSEVEVDTVELQETVLPPVAVDGKPKIAVPTVESKLFGTDLFGEPMTPCASGPLAKRFLVPPFSVLNARDGDWQDRKRAWLSLGIKSELGRGCNLQGLIDSNDEYRYNKDAYLARIGRGPLSDCSPGGGTTSSL